MSANPTRRINLGPSDRVVSADLIATAITCIADFVGHAQARAIQQDEQITVDEARKVMALLAGDET